jgi:hypothetical protein
MDEGNLEATRELFVPEGGVRPASRHLEVSMASSTILNQRNKAGRSFCRGTGSIILSGAHQPRRVS